MKNHKAMSGVNVLERMRLVLENKACFMEMVPFHHLHEIESEIRDRYAQGAFAEEFYRERLTSFNFRQTLNYTTPESIIIIAVPQPKMRLVFQWKGHESEVFIPPTYDLAIDAAVRDQIGKILRKNGYWLERAVIPLKAMAVRGGLAEYGRNNICYVRGKGSFFRLVAFFTDLPCLDDHWRGHQVMERCTKCKACINACPLGAIDQNRFLLRSELCLTFHNEHSGDFPQHINPALHHCLWGCLKCQNVCPENKHNINWTEDREWFVEKETVMILQSLPLDQLPHTTLQKLERVFLLDDYALVARNLGVLLA